MATLAGWWGNHLNNPEPLRRMAEVMSGPAPFVEEHRSDGLALIITRPAVAAGGSYLAATEGNDVVLAFSGYLHSDDPDHQRNPAPYCLRLYQDLGPEFARQLNGSFAIALCDRTRNQLLLITDRIATRALYYSFQDDFVFAGEVKAILQYPGISRKPNPDRLREFLVMGCLPGLDTYYDHIKQVPAATVMIWDGAQARFLCYWQPQFTWTPNSDIRELAARAVQAMRNAVRRSCIAGQRPGLMLSGGLDSRTIAATADRPLLCMTMHREECYEVITARQVAQALGHEHIFVQLDRTFPLELLTPGSLIGDGMHIFGHAQSLSLLNVLQERGIDRLLNGWSMDVHYSGICLPTKSISMGGRTLPLPILAAPDQINLAANFVGGHQLASPDTLGKLLHPYPVAQVTEQALTRVAGIVEDLQRTVPNKYDAADWLELLANSVKQSDYLNVLAMDWLVPAAVPAHDNEMIETMLATPPQYRFNQRIYWHMYQLLNPRLRTIPYTSIGGPLSRNVWWNWARKWAPKTYREVLAPRLRRLLHLPPAKDYVASWPAAGPAMRTCEQWHRTLRTHAEDSHLAALGVISGDGLRTLIDQHLSGQAHHVGPLLAWLTLEEWLRSCG